MIIWLSPANSQCEFAPNSQYCEFQAEFGANSRCERIRSEFGDFKLNSLRICIPSDDDSPGISSRSSCDDDDDPSRGLQEIWTLQQLDEWYGWQIPTATTAGRAESAPRPPVTKSGALIRRLGLVDPPGGPFLNWRGAPWVGNDPKSPKSGAFIRHLGLGIDPKRHEEFVALGRKWPSIQARGSRCLGFHPK